MHNTGNVAPLKGSIDADGDAKFTTEKGHPGTMKFTGDHFEANWTSGGCHRHALGKRGNRAADGTQTAV